MLGQRTPRRPTARVLRGQRLGRRERLEIAGRTLWAAFRRRPWLAQLSPLGRPLPLPGLTAHADWMLGALDGLGLDPATVPDIHILLYSHGGAEPRLRTVTKVTGMSERSERIDGHRVWLMPLRTGGEESA